MGRRLSAPWIPWRAAGWWVALALALFVLIDKVGLPQLDLQDRKGLVAALSDFWSTSVDPEMSSQNDHPMLNERHLSNSSAHGESHSHPSEAMYFFILTLVIGTFILQIADMKIFHGLQQSVAICCLGCLTALVADVMNMDKTGGGIVRSLKMWANMDPHLLLFTLLPPLLAGDAMTIDTYVARKVWKQCVFLAGPGVVVNAFATAGIMKLLLPQWPFLLCLTTGSILCATDPVAVVALLKELGASPTLTVQIQGESLLNDGTAIVMFSVAWEMLKGEEYDTSDIAVILVKKVIYALIFGAFTGIVFLGWINSAKHRFHHNSSIIQVSLTVACAYFSFCFAEGLLHTSGVLSTVAASLVMADRMWTEVIEKEAMHTIWHMFEYLGNTIIFTVAGVLTGNGMLRMQVQDYGLLLAIYVALTLLRFGILFASRPLLRRLHPDRRSVEVQDAIVMGWGGLRGAVGLAMGLQVTLDNTIDYNKTGIEKLDTERVLFFVGGVALMTMVINATTCPALVTYLGITQRPECKKKIMLLIKDRLMEIAQIEIRTPAVKRAITGILDDIESQINQSRRTSETSERLAGLRTSLTHAILSVRMGVARCNESLIIEYEEERNRFLGCDGRKRQQLHRILPENLLFEDADLYVERIRVNSTDPEMARAFTEVYHKALKAEYWKMIDEGRVRNELSYVLLTSVINSLSAPSMDVCDFAYILKRLGLNNDEGEVESMLTLHDDAPFKPEPCTQSTTAQWLASNLWFNVFIGTSIFVNSLLVYFYGQLKQHHHSQLVWVLLELVFVCVYMFEFAIKVVAQKNDYWSSIWSCFEFVLMLVGIVTLGLWWAQVSQEPGKKTPLFKIIDVLTVLRILRFFRFFRIIQFLRIKAKGQMIAADNADFLLRFDALTCFIKAHSNTTKELVMFFQKHSDCEVDQVPVEFARSIIQSETAIYKALFISLQQLPLLDPWVLEEIEICQQNIDASMELEEIISHTCSRGVLAASEAEDLKNMFHSHIMRFSRKLRDVRGGRVDKPEYAQALGITESMAMDSLPPAQLFGHPLDDSEVQEKDLESESEDEQSQRTKDIVSGKVRVNFADRFSLQESTNEKCISTGEPWRADAQMDSMAPRRSSHVSMFSPKTLESRTTHRHHDAPLSSSSANRRFSVQEKKATDDDGRVRLPMPKKRPSKDAISRPLPESQGMEGKSKGLGRTSQMSSDSLGTTRQQVVQKKGQNNLPVLPPASSPSGPEQPTGVSNGVVEAKKKKEKKKTGTTKPPQTEIAVENATEQKQNLVSSRPSLT